MRPHLQATTRNSSSQPSLALIAHFYDLQFITGSGRWKIVHPVFQAAKGTNVSCFAWVASPAAPDGAFGNGRTL
jgi:hypothetical protein